MISFDFRRQHHILPFAIAGTSVATNNSDEKLVGICHAMYDATTLETTSSTVCTWSPTISAIETHKTEKQSKAATEYLMSSPL